MGERDIYKVECEIEAFNNAELKKSKKWRKRHVAKEWREAISGSHLGFPL